MKTVLSLSMILFFSCILSQTNNTLPKSIHNFNVEDIYGNKFDFKTLKGKKVMVVNTASKCGLTYQYENLENLYSQYKNNNFEVLAVSMYYDPPSRVVTYAKNNQLPFPVILDFDKTIKNAFKNIKLTPTSILIDRNGKIINTIVGEINFSTFNKALEEELKKII